MTQGIAAAEFSCYPEGASKGYGTDATFSE